MAKRNTYSLPLEKENKFDFILLFTVLGLIIFGLISIYSATYESSMTSNFNKQLISVGLGLTVMIITAYLPENLLKLNSYIFYGLSILLLLLVLWIGTEVYGTKGWIRLGGFNIQPAEIAKIGVLFALASYLSKKGTDIRTFRDQGVSLLFAAVPTYLILKQPDTGSASVILIAFLGVLFWVGYDAFILFTIFSLPIIIISSLKGGIFFIAAVSILSAITIFFRKKVIYIVVAISLFIGTGVAAPLVYNNLMPHQKKRIDSFLSHGSDPLGADYNVMQSKLAVGSGGITGKGFLKGSQTQLRYVPMQWTDFIFSVGAEEFGFIGSSIVIILYLVLIYRALSISYEVNSKFFSVICIGISVIFIYHILINIGMVIGLMPVMGIPLPFMSYGGTSMIFNLLLVGILLNSYRNRRKNI